MPRLCDFGQWAKDNGVDFNNPAAVQRAYDYYFSKDKNDRFKRELVDRVRAMLGREAR